MQNPRTFTLIAAIAALSPLVTACDVEEPASDACTEISELNWEQKSPLGFSGQELAQSGAFAQTSKSFSSSMQLTPQPPKIIHGQPFGTSKPLTMELYVPPGPVQHHSGPGCSPFLSVQGTLTLRTQEGLLNETMQVQLRSSDNKALSASASLDGLNNLVGTLKTASVEPTTSSISQADLSIQIEAGQGPSRGHFAAIIQTPAPGSEPGVMFKPIKLLEFPASPVALTTRTR